MKRKQSGFTLIEIAIVLVIIGLLLGGVLKGQELINSAKVKNLATDFKNIPVFIYGYQDKFKALPGDDKNAVAHVNGTKATTPTSSGGNACTGGDCTGNGVIDGLWTSTTLTDESQLFWQQVRLAGLAPGPTTVAAGGDYRPTNAEGGAIGIQSNNSTFTTITSNAAGTANTGMSGSYIICSAGILGKFVKQLDTTLDDGDTDTGSVRVADPANAGKSIATTAIQDGQGYTVCMGV
ncbi:MAG: prepilin-type N-terminal cleavage/methylation domain-containing protein [Sideroxydans sp.]|nr:prepilin-type N-terminal cleavage/methylation domain-containing protein [Sideroxydans sp.]